MRKSYLKPQKRDATRSGAQCLQHALHSSSQSSLKRSVGVNVLITE